VKLASVVLSRADVKLAFEVFAGGPFVHARATELASLVLGREAEASGVAGLGEGAETDVVDGHSGGRGGFVG
jgi:hypothetical protein